MKKLGVVLFGILMIAGAGCEYYDEKPTATIDGSRTQVQGAGDEKISEISKQIDDLKNQMAASNAEEIKALEEKIAELEKKLAEASAPAPVPAPAGKKNPGEPCTMNEECSSGGCGDSGICLPPLPPPVAKKGAGEACTANDECISGNCVPTAAKDISKCSSESKADDSPELVSASGTIVYMIDTIKPTIVSVSTLQDQRSFRVEFSEPMDLEFIKAHNSIHVFNLVTALPIPLSGQITGGEGFDVTNPKKIDFVLAQKAKKQLASNGDEIPYMVVVTADGSTGGLDPKDAARDVAGNTLKDHFSKSFLCGSGGADTISCAE